MKFFASQFPIQKYKIKIYRTIILPVAACLPVGCETWSLTFREERSLRVFENRLLRKIFEAKRDEVTGKWRRLQKVECHDLYSPHFIRIMKLKRMRWAGNVERMMKGEVHIGFR
jgi:hypothetical protein